ncbi:hypothetical protein DM860_011480 [Cuscuta australis]|uniref:Phospho-2-dehydro-3-deoxyheptonate aldolase n=1 Tax=Cuscuta australis TaxID=267555 RepID=A0A328DQG2_9ASTE|nr:hypothetical protein DM860_011480 [Cuscuta australis]
MIGQFVKPRSGPFEVKDNMKLPSYRRDNGNEDAFDGNQGIWTQIDEEGRIIEFARKSKENN